MSAGAVIRLSSVRLAMAGALALLPACKQKPVTQEECDRLLTRYAEMQVRVDQPKPSAIALDRAREDARTRAAKDPAFQSCTTSVSRESMDCALAAWDADQIERCLIPVP